MKNLHLLIHSKNSTLAEDIKSTLEATGRYQIQIEKEVTENCATEGNDLDIFIIGETAVPPLQKVSPLKKNVCLGEYTLDVNLRKLQWKDQHFHLSYREAKILSELIENHGRTVSRHFLLQNYWGEASFYKSRSLDVLISKLRKYLKLDPSIEIVNFRSEGLQIIY
jgi:hypothetical protein